MIRFATNYDLSPSSTSGLVNLIWMAPFFAYCLGFIWRFATARSCRNNFLAWSENWKPGNNKAAHPNSRFCAPSDHCPIMDKAWEDPKGVPISAILFGGRRPQGVPLVYQSFNWQHGVFVASSMSSEATSAAEHKGKTVMRDPFAMRPFFGYNFGKNTEHWLEMEKPNHKMPKIFHVNWFRVDENGHCLWPGELVLILPSSYNWKTSLFLKS